MASTTTGPEPKVQVRRMFTAPRAKVFEAWTQREKLEKWMCRMDESHVMRCLEFDLREGGNYRLKSGIPSGPTYVMRGVYREVKPPEKLVFTWSWERFTPSGEKDEETEQSLVTVEFNERGNWTEVLLTHEFLRTAKLREDHHRGWNACFDMLTKSLPA